MVGYVTLMKGHWAGIPAQCPFDGSDVPIHSLPLRCIQCTCPISLPWESHCMFNAILMEGTLGRCTELLEQHYRLSFNLGHTVTPLLRMTDFESQDTQ